VVKPLDEQAELLAGQLSSVISGMSVVPGQRLADSCAPERQLTVVTGRRHVNHDLGQPAVVRHGANLRDRAAGRTPGINHRGTSAPGAAAEDLRSSPEELIARPGLARTHILRLTRPATARRYLRRYPDTDRT
jgi:hypothetical protein